MKLNFIDQVQNPRSKVGNALENYFQHPFSAKHGSRTYRVVSSNILVPVANNGLTPKAAKSKTIISVLKILSYLTPVVLVMLIGKAIYRSQHKFTIQKCKPLEPLDVIREEAMVNGSIKDLNIHRLSIDDLARLYHAIDKRKAFPSSKLSINLGILKSHMHRLCIEDPKRIDQFKSALQKFNDPECRALNKALQQTVSAHKKVHRNYKWYNNPWYQSILEGNNGPILSLGARPLRNLKHDKYLTDHYRAFVTAQEKWETAIVKPFNIAVTPSQLKKKGVRQIILGTPDGKPPSKETLKQTAEFIHENITQGRPVYVHCAAGIGRSPTVVACYLSQFKRDELNLKSADEAIAYVKSKRPPIKLARGQIDAVREYWNTYVKPSITP